MKYIGIIFGLTLLFSCKEKAVESTDKDSVSIMEEMVALTPAQAKNAAIETGKPVMQPVITTIKVNGMVDVPPQSLISVSFPLGGYLKQSHLLPGTSVRKGEVIAVMEDQSYVQLQQDYLMAKARMEYLQADVERQQSLSAQDATSKKSYQQVQADYKTQQVLIKALEEKLRIIGIQPEQLQVNNISRTVPVRSPINGYVTKINVNVGKYVNPADVLFELVDPNDIHAALTVFEKDFALVRKGMQAKVALADQPEKQYPVEVILTTRNIDANRSGLVHCHFDQKSHDLLPGMFLTGEFQLKQPEAAVIGEDAVVRFEGKEYVFLVKGQEQYLLQAVETAPAGKGMLVLKPQAGIDWKSTSIAVKNTHVLLGKLKNKMED